MRIMIVQSSESETVSCHLPHYEEKSDKDSVGEGRQRGRWRERERERKRRKKEERKRNRGRGLKAMYLRPHQTICPSHACSELYLRTYTELEFPH